jgi:hypothetical protein
MQSQIEFSRSSRLTKLQMSKISNIFLVLFFAWTAFLCQVTLKPQTITPDPVSCLEKECGNSTKNIPPLPSIPPIPPTAPSRSPSNLIPPPPPSQSPQEKLPSVIIPVAVGTVGVVAAIVLGAPLMIAVGAGSLLGWIFNLASHT